MDIALLRSAENRLEYGPEDKRMKIKLVAIAAVTLSFLALACAQATRERTTPASNASVAAQSNKPQKMTITRSGERASRKGPEANFTSM
jgi:hypothetical protein